MRSLAAALEPDWQKAAAAWPRVVVTLEDLAAHIARLHPAAPGGTQPLGELSLHVTDLYLALACARGDPHALMAFDRAAMPRARRAFLKAGVAGADIRDLEQTLRIRLLTPQVNGPPRIATYSGRGPLVGWVQVAALRHALNTQSGADPVGRLDQASLPAPGHTPESQVVNAEGRRHLGRALREAWRGLAPRDREVLQLHFGEGISAVELGRRFRVHRATIERWLGRARTTLLVQTRRCLARATQLGPSELDSLVGAARSRLDVTLSDLSAAPTPARVRK
jgi:RNA polymerase sigma-70 factor (ECF subfamily)